MVIDRKKQTIEHKLFKDVIDYFDDGDVLILNNTKVFLHVCTETKKKQGLELKFSY
jgi:S-adenosylmethionine:tRNA ribosyltransferase-isomerase